MRVSTVVAANIWTTTGPCWERLYSSSPTQKDVPKTGMLMPGPPSVPMNASCRPSWPSLKMMTPTAPACWAFWAFWKKVQVPRWMSAILPGSKLSKSDCSHPLVLPGVDGGGITTSTASISAVGFPLPEYSIVKKSSPTW